ncbi:unnamed protein product [Bursaphelenchus xylophilus]|uniref:(pine wood nematode) hypothetical protein n=1 Tax=Bursaphelenchus xylophilus TaxID=6326 RepID=A0A1I7RQL6_BURXY|nr:unnamed protein product [Bursaphelenchus xylophilus]CAG9104788.1 unnamed protein product [Bursaphelenchus xylophilus]
MHFLRKKSSRRRGPWFDLLFVARPATPRGKRKFADSEQIGEDFWRAKWSLTAGRRANGSQGVAESARRLATFVGGKQLESAAFVAAGGPAAEPGQLGVGVAQSAGGNVWVGFGGL